MKLAPLGAARPPDVSEVAVLEAAEHGRQQDPAAQQDERGEELGEEGWTNCTALRQRTDFKNEPQKPTARHLVSIGLGSFPDV